MSPLNLSGLYPAFSWPIKAAARKVGGAVLVSSSGKTFLEAPQGSPSFRLPFSEIGRAAVLCLLLVKQEGQWASLESGGSRVECTPELALWEERKASGSV